MYKVYRFMNYEISHPLEDTWLSWPMSPNSPIYSHFGDFYILGQNHNKKHQKSVLFYISLFYISLQFETFLDYSETFGQEVTSPATDCRTYLSEGGHLVPFWGPRFVYFWKLSREPYVFHHNIIAHAWRVSCLTKGWTSIETFAKERWIID